MRTAVRLLVTALSLLNFGLLPTLAQPTLAQPTEEWRTRVSPLPEEEILHPCEYRMFIPKATTKVKAVWVIFDRGQDYLKWYEDRQVRAFSEARQLALILAAHCRSKEREDMIILPETGVGRALFTALDQFADASGHAELKTVSIVPMGWSGAGALVCRLAAYRPARYLAGIAYAPGQYEPLGMNTIELSNEAIRNPQLIIANGGDDINGTERPYAYFRKYFDKSAPWTFVVQNRLPHCCLQNAQRLILEWLGAILSGEKPSSSSSYAYLTVQLSPTLDEWKRPTFNATSGRIAARGKPKRDELPSGWLPSSDFAQEWRLLVQRPQPIAVWKP